MASLDINALAKEIEKEIRAKVNEIFKEVAEEVQIDLAERASADVYGVYAPKIYERRGTLEDPSNYSISEGDLMVSVTPIASFNRAYGGWNEGNELGGFMNFGNYWHGYVTNYASPMPRPYLTNYVESRAIWNEVRQRLDAELGEWASAVDFNVFLGDG